ncbi:hypothetical protein [Mycobacterium sp.]|uniref:hypothetical protein n=1 Tax=Mycobacterium sp. TaxID=1785 RepID=UPI002634DABC|nr:hypothetical protein [Mycobacterium sp.]
MAAIDPMDPMFKPVTVKQAMEITSRSRRTLERWVEEKHLTKYELQHRRQVVVLFNEDELTRVEKERNDAAIENRDRIRRRGGRPGPRPAPDEPAT